MVSSPPSPRGIRSLLSFGSDFPIPVKKTSCVLRSIPGSSWHHIPYQSDYHIALFRWSSWSRIRSITAKISLSSRGAHRFHLRHHRRGIRFHRRIPPHYHIYLFFISDV